MKIENYINLKDEGIREIEEVTIDDFPSKVFSGEIDDGYTLAAFALYSAYATNIKEVEKE